MIYVTYAGDRDVIYCDVCVKLSRLRMCSPEEAFKASVECITGPISKLISTQGMPAVYEALDAEGKKVFEKVIFIRVAPRVWSALQ